LRITPEAMSKMSYRKYATVLAILGCEFCERLAAYGIGSSLTLFLRSKLGYSIEAATVSTAIVVAMATLFALAGGFISDARFGRKKTILVGCCIYFVALLCISLITVFFELTDDLSFEAIEVLFWAALISVGIGGGGIKANVGVFGADQLVAFSAHGGDGDEHVNLISDHARADSDNRVSYNTNSNANVVSQQAPENAAELNNAELVQSYWNWFYLSINVGALIAYTGIAYLCQDISFALGWSIPTLAMLTAILIFLSQNQSYHEPAHDSSMVADFVGMSWYALRNRRRKREISQEFDDNVLQSFRPSSQAEESRASAVTPLDGDGQEYAPLPSSLDVAWLDVAKLRYNGPYDDALVEEVKSVYSVFGFLPFMVLYWLVYSAMNSLFFSQGCQMNYIMNGGFEFPIAALNVANTLVIIILIPIMDRFVYPCIHSGCCRFSMLKKVGVGYFILALAMIVAAVIEIARKSSTTLSIVSTCDSAVYISDLSVLWQIPQYVLVGVSEIFASIVSLEFFSGQAPQSMKSVVYSINLMMMGIGMVLSTLLVVIVDVWKPEWIPDDLDNGYLEYYFFLIAALMIVGLVAFIPYAKKYRYRAGTDLSTMDLMSKYSYDPVSQVEI